MLQEGNAGGKKEGRFSFSEVTRGAGLLLVGVDATAREKSEKESKGKVHKARDLVKRLGTNRAFLTKAGPVRPVWTRNRWKRKL